MRNAGAAASFRLELGRGSFGCDRGNTHQVAHKHGRGITKLFNVDDRHHLERQHPLVLPSEHAHAHALATRQT